MKCQLWRREANFIAPEPVGPIVPLNDPEPTPLSLGPPFLEQGPIVTLENGPPSPSKPTSFSNGVPAPAGDPYIVTLPDSKPQTTSAPPPPADGISFTNSPGLPAGDPYVVTLPGSKPQATGAPNNPVISPPPDGISFTNTVGAPLGDPSLVNLLGPKAIPSRADGGTTFLNGLLLPKGDPYIVTLPGAGSAKQNGGSRLEGTPVPKLASPPPLSDQNGALPSLEANLASSPKAEGGALIPPPNPVIDIPPTDPEEGKFEPYNPNAAAPKPEAEVVEASEAAGIFDSNTWGPIAWEPVPGKPKSAGAMPTIVAPQPVAGPKDSAFPGLQEPAVVPAPAMPSTNVAPQPIAGPTTAPDLPTSPKDSVFPGLQEPTSPVFPSTNIAPQPIAGPKSTPDPPTSPEDSVFPGLQEPAPVIPSTNIAPQPIAGTTTLPAPESPKPQDAVPVMVEPVPAKPETATPAKPENPSPAKPETTASPPIPPIPAPKPAPPAPQTNPAPAQPAPKPFGVVSLYAQCGGRGYTGATTCATGSKCKVQNEWYHQCVADSSSSSSSSSPPSQQPKGGEKQKGRPEPQEIYNFGILAPAPIQRPSSPPPSPPSPSSNGGKQQGGERGRTDPQEIYNYRNKPFLPAAVDEDEF